MATIRKRGSSWHVQVRRSGQPTLTRRFKRKADADLWARKTETDLDRGDLPQDRRILRNLTLADLLVRYRAKVTPTNRGIVQESYRLRQLLTHPLASTPLSKLSPAHITKYRDQRLAQVKPVTVRRKLALISHVISIARCEWDLPLATNPVSMISMPSASRSRDRRLEEGEMEKLVAGCRRCRTSILEPVVRFALETAMRRGEILNVRWSDIDFERRTLHIPITKNGHERTIPQSSGAMGVLLSLSRDQERVFPASGNAIRLAWERLNRSGRRRSRS